MQRYFSDKKASLFFPRHLLLTIYKSFIAPHVDYGDIIYDQPNNQAFSNIPGVVHYNATLAVAGVIWGPSPIIVFQELGLDPLEFRWWFLHLYYFHKIKNYSFSGTFLI